jgi:hypothetical protein
LDSVVPPEDITLAATGPEENLESNAFFLGKGDFENRLGNQIVEVSHLCINNDIK